MLTALAWISLCVAAALALVPLAVRSAVAGPPPGPAAPPPPAVQAGHGPVMTMPRMTAP
jgi:hypothetical protein